MSHLPQPLKKLFLLLNISAIFKKRISQQLSNFNHRMLKQNPTSPTSSSKRASMALGGRLDVKIWPRVGLLCGVVARSRLREPDPRGSKGMCRWLICNSNNQAAEIKLAVEQERRVLRKGLHSSLRPFWVCAIANFFFGKYKIMLFFVLANWCKNLQFQTFSWRLACYFRCTALRNLTQHTKKSAMNSSKIIIIVFITVCYTNCDCEHLHSQKPVHISVTFVTPV